MILLFNIKVTDQPWIRYQRADWLPVYRRGDIFKYCLASYSSMRSLISKAVFYIELAPEYAERQEELEAYIYHLFPDCLLRWHRNYYCRDWRASFEKDIAPVEDDLVWLACNDDHIFIDYSLDVIKDGLRILQEDPNPYSIIYYSHWPEQMNLHNLWNSSLVSGGNYVCSPWCTYDSIMILKKERLRHYWFDHDFGDLEVFRTDSIHQINLQMNEPAYAPTRELVRHYDGYSHVGNMQNIVPPLFIPHGFFERNMTIRYGYSNRDEKTVNVNPLSSNYFAATPGGTDYRWTLEDIPLFWKDRISRIDCKHDVDESMMKHKRNEAFLAMTHVPMNAFNIHFDGRKSPPPHWFANHLRAANLLSFRVS